MTIAGRKAFRRFRLGLQGEAAGTILRNAGSLVGTSTITTALGFPYWWLAVRLFTPAEVGFASAAISALALLGTFTTLGLGTLLMGEMSQRRDDAGALLFTALLISGVAGGLLGTLFAVSVGHVSGALRPLGGSVGSVAIFGAGVALTALTSVLDSSLIGLLRGGLQFWRNLVFSVAKLALVVGAGLWLIKETGLLILESWVTGIVLSLLALLGVLLLNGARANASSFRLSLERRLALSALSHHLTNMGLFITPLVMPILATQLLTPGIGGFF